MVWSILRCNDLGLLGSSPSDTAIPHIYTGYHIGRYRIQWHVLFPKWVKLEWAFVSAKPKITFSVNNINKKYLKIIKKFTCCWLLGVDVCGNGEVLGAGGGLFLLRSSPKRSFKSTFSRSKHACCLFNSDTTANNSNFCVSNEDLVSIS